MCKQESPALEHCFGVKHLVWELNLINESSDDPIPFWLAFPSHHSSVLPPILSSPLLSVHYVLLLCGKLHCCPIATFKYSLTLSICVHSASHHPAWMLATCTGSPSPAPRPPFSFHLHDFQFLKDFLTSFQLNLDGSGDCLSKLSHKHTQS